MATNTEVAEAEKSTESVFQEEGVLKGTVSSLGLLFNVTKQLFYETIGKAKVTEDSEMKSKILNLQEIVAGYDELVALGHKYCTQFEALSATTAELSQVITTIGVKDRNESMIRVGESYRNISRLSLPYIASVRTFYDSLAHFREKVIGDTLDSKKQFDQARLLQDVFDNKLQSHLKLKDSSKPTDVALYEKVKEEYDNSVFMYEHLRKDLNVKIELLQMKRHNDMSHQMNIYLSNMHLYQDACSTVLNKIQSMPIQITDSPLPSLEDDTAFLKATSSKEEKVNKEKPAEESVNEQKNVQSVVVEEPKVEENVSVENKKESEEFENVELNK